MYGLLKEYLIYSVLSLFQIYSSLLNIFLDTFGPIKFVYYLEDNQIKNITLFYYFNVGPAKYLNGDYFFKIFTGGRTNHIIYSGGITDVDKIIFSEEYETRKRKNVILLNNSDVVIFDFNMLDNYVNNYSNLISSESFVHKFKFIDLKYVLKCFGINCTHVQFFLTKPFKKEVIPINNLNIYDIYENKN